jgi:hypothetical protein
MGKNRSLYDDDDLDDDNFEAEYKRKNEIQRKRSL